MNLTKALKQKKKLSKLAESYYVKFAAENSKQVGVAKSYDSQEMYEKWIKQLMH